MSSYLEDGYQTLIEFSLNGSVKLKEKTVTPPELDGGGGIETTTMRNEKRRTKAPKALYDVGNISLTVQYDPALYEDIKAMINKRQTITITFPDGDTLPLPGAWINKFSPSALSEGDFPTADIEIIDGGTEDGTEYEPTVAAA